MSLGFIVTLETFVNVCNNLTQTACFKKKVMECNFTYKFTVANICRRGIGYVQSKVCTSENSYSGL
jgi:hypothetical protein